MFWLVLNGLLCACPPVRLGDHAGVPETKLAKGSAEVLKPGEKEQSDTWLYKMGLFAQQGEVDELVEQAVNHWETSRKDAAWQIVGELACKLIDWEKRLHKRAKLDVFLTDDRKVPKPFADIGGLRLLGFHGEVVAPEYLMTNAADHSYLVRAGKIVINDSIARGILISGGSIDVVGQGCGDGIFFANDFVTLKKLGGVVVCNGEFKGAPLNSLVIAREGVLYSKIKDSVILSGGPVRCLNDSPTIENSTIISMKNVDIPKAAKLKDIVIKQDQHDALGPVRFFDPANAGIVVETDKGKLRIKQVHADGIFAKAGLASGDLVLSLDKSPVNSVASFRKHLRKSLAGQQQILFEIRRGEKAMSIGVKTKR
jgi:hypothetical protein